MSALRFLLDKYFIKQPRFRRFVTSMLESDKQEIIEVCGTRICINRRREHGYLRASRIAASSSLLRDEIPVLINLSAVLAQSSGTFVDVGANVGVYSHTLQRLHHLLPELRVIAFEPQPETFARLSQLANPAIQFFNCAIGSFDGVDTFVDGAVSHVFTQKQNQNSYNIPEATKSVSVKRLDSLDLGIGPFVIKIDVEGQELNVLKGASRLLGSGQVKAVYIDGFKDAEVVDVLRSHGFTLRDGRTLEEVPDGQVFSLLAIKDK